MFRLLFWIFKLLIDFFFPFWAELRTADRVLIYKWYSRKMWLLLKQHYLWCIQEPDQRQSDFSILLLVKQVSNLFFWTAVSYGWRTLSHVSAGSEICTSWQSQTGKMHLLREMWWDGNAWTADVTLVLIFAPSPYHHKASIFVLVVNLRGCQKMTKIGSKQICTERKLTSVVDHYCRCRKRESVNVP